MLTVGISTIDMLYIRAVSTPNSRNTLHAAPCGAFHLAW